MESMALPVVDPSELRPGRAWYWIGAGVVAVGAVLGIALFVFGLVRAVALPDFTAEFADGEAATVTVDNLDEGDWLVYVNDEVPGSRIDCLVTGPDPSAAADSVSYSHTYSVGSEYWQLAKEIRVAEPGDYEITCAGADGARYGVGQGGGFLGATLLSLSGALAGLVGSGIGLAILIVTGVRRGKDKQRLLQQRMPPPGHPPQTPGW